MSACGQPTMSSWPALYAGGVPREIGGRAQSTFHIQLWRRTYGGWHCPDLSPTPWIITWATYHCTSHVYRPHIPLAANLPVCLPWTSPHHGQPHATGANTVLTCRQLRESHELLIIALLVSIVLIYTLYRYTERQTLRFTLLTKQFIHVNHLKHKSQVNDSPSRYRCFLQTSEWGRHIYCCSCRHLGCLELNK